MGVIFFFSAQPGEDSDEVSTGLLSLLFGQGLDFALLWNALARKVAHVLEFGALAAPVAIFFGTFRLRRVEAFCWPVAFCVLYAISDELHQLFVEGRSCEAADVLVDSFGVLLSVAVVRLLARLYERRKKTKPIERTDFALDDASELVLDAFSAFVCGKPAAHAPTEAQAEAFVAVSFAQKILPMTAEAVLSSGETMAPALRSRLKLEAAAQAAGQIRRTEPFLRAYRAMTQAGAQPLCVKGAACRALYPKPELRISADEDLLVREEDFDRCAGALRDLGFVSMGAGEDYEVTFRHRESGAVIELHRSLFPEDGGVYSRFNTLLGDLFDGTETVAVEGVPVLCPAAEKHVLYLILHTFKHFLVAGVGVRQLADIALFAQAHPVDWQTVFDKCASVRLEGFLSAVLCVGIERFGLDAARINAPRFDAHADTEPLLRDVMSGGIYGERNEDHRRAGHLTFRRYSDALSGKRTGFRRALFPPKESIRRKYPFAAKHGFLLPAAYLARLCRYIFTRHDADKTLSDARQRSDLMRRYGIF